MSDVDADGDCPCGDSVVVSAGCFFVIFKNYYTRSVMTQPTDDDDMDYNSTHESEELSWSEFISFVIEPAVFSSSTQQRNTSFHSLKLKITSLRRQVPVTLPPQDVLSKLLLALAATIPRFSDSSRKYVLDALTELCKVARISHGGSQGDPVEHIINKAVARILEKSLKDNM